MIAADAPLSEVLTSLVLLMEGQAEGLRCSILLLNRDGKHVRHGAAPNLPEAYVKAVDGVGDWAMQRFLRHCDVHTQASHCD